MRRRTTIGEKHSPVSQEFKQLAVRLVPGMVDRLLSYLWDALEQLAQDVLCGVDVTGDEDELERSLTEYLVPRLARVMPSDFPAYPAHAAREYETRKPAPAQAPEYDIAFKLWHNERVMLPIEAKVLKTDQRVAEYVKEITNNFITCRYAPFSSVGFMLGYLIAGSPQRFFDNVAAAVPCEMQIHPGFTSQPQRASLHERTIPPGRAYPTPIVLHHLVHRLN